MQDEVFIDHEGQHRYKPPTDHSHKPTAANQPQAKHGSRTGHQLPPLQTVVQLNIYRDAGGHFEYLLLRRIDEDKQFWQVVTQLVDQGDTIADSLREAVGEQVGIHGFRHLSHETYSYEWYAGQQRGRDIVFAAEVSPQAVVRIDDSRYNAYAWLPAAEAIQRLKWDGNKQALRQLDEHLRHKRLTTPATTIVSTHQPVDNTAAKNIENTNHSPYGGNVPKRLPDRPEDGVEELKPYPDEEDERAVEWFL